MEPLLERLWKRSLKESPEVINTEIVEEVQENDQLLPLNIATDEMHLESMQDSQGNLQGPTKIITGDQTLQLNIQKGVITGPLISTNSANPQENLHLNFNSNGLLDGKCIVDGKEMIFQNGKLISMK